MILTIEKSCDKMTVKDYLYGKLRFSTSLVKKLKYTECGILVNGKPVTVRCLLNAGDTLTLAYADTDDDVSENIMPVNLPLDIIFEDEHIIALNKCAGMPTHPSHNHHSDTLANALAYYFAKLGRPFVFRAINRLDADTSGIVLVAKSKHAAHLLASELQANDFEKGYVALLHGRLDTNGRIEHPIMRAPDSTMLRCVDTDNTDKSKYALSVYSVIKAEDTRTLVKAYPITGRTHQLRVHFSYLGHPIFGDGLYGITSDGSDFPRLALHCASLEFTHPFTGERLTLTAPVPDELTL